jgi:hypothetical protein
LQKKQAKRDERKARIQTLLKKFIVKGEDAAEDGAEHVSSRMTTS